MGMAIKKKMGIDPNEKKKHTSKRLKSGSKREIKWKAEIKEMRQLITRTSNEIYWRKQQWSGTPKEKKILKQIKEKINKAWQKTKNISPNGTLGGMDWQTKIQRSEAGKNDRKRQNEYR